MAVKTRITDKGIVSYQATPDDVSANVGLGMAGAEISTLSTSAVLTPADAGKPYIISGSSALTPLMPAASLVPGSQWVFRVGSVHAHGVISGSAETTTKPFTNGTSSGGKVAMANIVGSSVVLVSDGTNYIVVGNSGSLTFT